MNDPQELFKDEEHKKRFKHFIENPTLPSEEERERVDKEVEREFKWWGDTPGYADEDEILSDYQEGVLVKVESNNNFQLIMRLRNPDLENWPPYLKKQAHALLLRVTEMWREQMNAESLPPNIRLSVTNLVLSERYRQEVIEKGKLATDKSSHTKGESFDIDGAGYYENGEGINPRLTEDYKDRYEPRVHEILESILKRMQKENKLNYIKEFPGTGNQSFHITRNPKYLL